MKDRESYSDSLIEEERRRNLTIRERKTKVINRVHMAVVNLQTWDVDEEDELAHIETLLDQIEPILDTPFKS